VILETKNLTKKYPIREGLFQSVQDHDVAVRNVDLNVREDNILGLVGESGSGKSTLARLLLKLETPTSGQIFLSNQRIDQLSQRQFRSYRKDIQIVFQDPQESFDPRFTIRRSIAEGLRNLTDLSSSEREDRILEVCREVNLGREVLDKYPHQLSGGQRQRVGIARALVVDPQIIVWDEPTSALDVSIQAQIINLLLDLKEEFGLTYVFISHDMNLVRFVSDRVAVMKDGRIVEEGESRQIYQSPQSQYTQRLLEASKKYRPESIG
jgi:ABC-type glutathione transport system ATPase component